MGGETVSGKEHPGSRSKAEKGPLWVCEASSLAPEGNTHPRAEFVPVPRAEPWSSLYSQPPPPGTLMSQGASWQPGQPPPSLLELPISYPQPSTPTSPAAVWLSGSLVGARAPRSGAGRGSPQAGEGAGAAEQATPLQFLDLKESPRNSILLTAKKLNHSRQSPRPPQECYKALSCCSQTAAAPGGPPRPSLAAERRRKLPLVPARLDQPLSVTPSPAHPPPHPCLLYNGYTAPAVWCVQGHQSEKAGVLWGAGRQCYLLGGGPRDLVWWEYGLTRPCAVLSLLLQNTQHLVGTAKYRSH